MAATVFAASTAFAAATALTAAAAFAVAALAVATFAAAAFAVATATLRADTGGVAPPVSPGRAPSGCETGAAGAAPSAITVVTVLLARLSSGWSRVTAAVSEICEPLRTRTVIFTVASCGGVRKSRKQVSCGEPVQPGPRSASLPTSSTSGGSDTARLTSWAPPGPRLVVRMM